MMNQLPPHSHKLLHNSRGLAETIALSGGLLSSGLLIAGLFGRAPMPLLAGVFGLGASATGGVMGGQIEQLRSSKRRQLAEMEQERDRLQAELASMLDAQVQLRQKLAPYEAGDAAALLALPAVSDALGKVQSQAQSWQEQYQVVDRKLKEITTHLLDRNAQLEKCQQAAEGMEARLIAQVEESEAELEENHQEYLQLQREYNQLNATYKELSIHHAALQVQFEDKVKLRFHESSSELIREEINKAIAQKQLELQQSQAAIDALRQEINESEELLLDVKDNALPIIRQKFDGEISARDSIVMQLSGQLEQYKKQVEQLLAPHLFKGKTAVDQAGNRIIEYFAGHGVLLDAIESVKLPGGFQLRFKIDRTPENIRLCESEFDKHCDYLALWGLSERPLDFALDTRNFLLSVNLYTTASDGKSRSATLTESKRQSAKAEALAPDMMVANATRFQELNCYAAGEFEEVVRMKFVPRVRVVAGSTGGKSPLLELIACAIAQVHKGELWLINPIPGSPKDWFHVPGVVAPGSDGIQAAIGWLGKAHQEFKARRNDLPGTADKPFITVMVDEINAIARDFPELGTVMKDFYQLSDHTRMGFLTASQGANVSGVSGGSQANRKTGNASKLMEEDFQNATQVFTAKAAKTWIEKHLKGVQMSDYLDRLTALNDLCAELNDSEGKSAYPSDPTIKKVSPDAYRVALVVSPREPDPFFVQLPPYSSYASRLNDVTYPASAVVTAPKANQQELGLIAGGKPKSFSCEFCGCASARRKGIYKASGNPRYVCSSCGRVPSSASSVDNSSATY